MVDLPQVLEGLGVHRRFAVDILSVAREVRPIGLIHAPQRVESELCDAITRAGLQVFARRGLVHYDDPESREGLLRDCANGEPANFTELWYARPSSTPLPTPEALFANPGLHLGYPPCCVAEWERSKSQRDLYHRYIFDTVCGHWEINRLATLFQAGLLIPDFYPCSMSCENARVFATPILAVAEETLNPEWVAETIRWMRAPVVQHSESLYAFPNWTLTGSRLELLVADAVKVPLAAVGRFDRPRQSRFRLVPFGHLAAAREAVFVEPNGACTVANLVQVGG